MTKNKKTEEKTKVRTRPTHCSFSAEEEELGTVSIASVGKG
jgi:hypothetical protein